MLPKEEAEKFWSFYDGQEWHTARGAYVGKKWKSKVIGWMNNSKQFGSSSTSDNEDKLILHKE